MKTVTEFTGLEIKRVLKLQSELLKASKELPQKNAAKHLDPSHTQDHSQDDLTAVVSHSTASAASEVADKVKNEPGALELAEQTNNIASADNASVEQNTGEETQEIPSEQSKPQVPASALQPKQASWNERADAIRPQLIEALKGQFSWKNEDRYHLAIDASRSVNPKTQDTLRKVTAYKKDKEEEKIPKFAQEIGDLVFLADYIIIKKDTPEHKHSKDPANRKKGKRGFKNKDFKEGDKPVKKFKKPVPNPIKSNNKIVVVEKK